MYFDSAEANKVLRYVSDTYGSEPEFLWIKSGNAVLRRIDNKKWYAALLNVPKEKLGINDDGNVDILDLKCDPILKGSLIDGKSYFPAYHMNKDHWITILLDGSVPPDDIFHLIDLSYDLAKK